MKITLNPPPSFEGTLKIPASKSYTQRVYAAALLCSGTTKVLNMGNSDDEQAALSIIKQAGAIVHTQDKQMLIIESKGISASAIAVNCGESGLSARMFTPILATQKNVVEINAVGSLLKRPMQLFNTIFETLKVDFQTTNGAYLPFRLEGPIIPCSMQIDGSLSSQFITGVIYALAANANDRPLILQIENLSSKPYILLTLEVLKKFGIDLKLEDNKIHFKGPYRFTAQEITIEGDWSSASFMLVAAAIKGKIRLKGLNLQSCQADRKILEALADYGASITIEEDCISIIKKEQKAFVFDATDCPDLFPPLAVLAAFAQGTSRIIGVHRLAHKESNRGLAIQQELGKMGILVEIKGDEMLVSGNKHCLGANVSSHGDHRIAMACAIAALNATHAVHIDGAEAVSKSYPQFFEHLAMLVGS